MTCSSYGLVWLPDKDFCWYCIRYFLTFLNEFARVKIKYSTLWWENAENMGARFFTLAPRGYVSTVLWWAFVICAGLSRQQEIREGGFCLSSTFMWIIEAVNKTPHFHCVKLKSAIECSRTEPSILHVHVGWVVSSFWTVVIWKKK